MKLAGWGRFPMIDTEVSAPRSEAALAAELAGGGMIARGNGRAYGDSAVGRPRTVRMQHFDRMLAFDEASGQLVAETGVLLGDIIKAFLPRGWFVRVTPGTKFVTLGGMIAADVHGKNHHKDGGMANCVDWIEVMGADGVVRRCSRTEEPELFGWTLGGMGLTGVIVRAAIRLRRVETAWIRQQTVPAANLDAAMALFERSGDATYSVAWIDCLAGGSAMGRSLVMLGEHARLDELETAQRSEPLVVPEKAKTSVPLDFPGWALNGLTVRVFNALYWWNGQRQAGTRLVDWDSYFYPLDAILGWNRIYGRKGFAQFQCALPLDRSREGLAALLAAIGEAGAGSFLAVLKRFGAEAGRPSFTMSFPMEGYTLALDFPVNPRTLALMGRLDAITLAHGGRFYLAKDSRMTAATLRASDARVDEFVAMRRAAGLGAVFGSAQAERLGL